MKKIYSCSLGAALLLSSLGAAQAQNRAASPGFDLGSTQALVQQLESQVAARATRPGPATVALRVSATQAFSGQVNHREDLGATGEYLVGEIKGVAGSSFLLRINGPAVEGHLIFRNTRQAYTYSADARGHVRVQPTDINRIICIDYDKPVGYREPTPAAATANRLAVISLQSFPGARGCVLLDFDGYNMPAGKGWNNGNAYNAPASGIENDNAQVQAFWELVSEDFRPFSMNVTTDENVFNAYPTSMRMRCVVSPGSGGTIAPGAGGVAYLTSFRDPNDTPCWVFMSDPKAGGEAASHEVGHTLGLAHDGRISPSEGYFGGHGSWAPIMGVGYYKPVTHWSRGEYASANNTQDDLAIMSSATYNVGYRGDDHSNGTAGATGLARSGNSLSGGGIIERTADQDYFVFSTSGGTASFNVNTVSRYGNLDIVVRLFNGSGAQIGTFDTAGGGNLNVGFSASLGAGTYYLQIDGTSQGNPATDGYSDYGSLGRYTIAGSAPAAAGGVATMFKDCNNGGTAVGLPVGDYNLAALQSRGILNDDISSLAVSGGYEVVFYENDNFAGASLVSGSNTCLVGAGWNDRASSLRVRAVSAAFSRLLEAEAHNVNNGMAAEACSEGGQNMGWVDAGDYLVWNGINFPSSGTYLIEYRVASGAAGGTISADLNAGTIQLGSTAIPGTNGWQNWTTVSRAVSINAGTYNFGIYAQTGGWNLNWVRITRLSARSAAGASPDLSASAVASLQLYPNPVSDKLYLDGEASLGTSRYRVLDAYGQSVASGSLAGGQVDVSRLRAGVYTLVVETPGQPQVVRRFNKQ